MWYVIWTTAKNEQRLESRINREVSPKLYEKCWLPMRLERQRHKGEERDIPKPLFPGYLFVDTQDPEGLHIALKKVKGFIRVLKNGDVFTPITEDEEAVIRRLTGEGGLVDISIGIIENGQLRVLQGALMGMEAYITKVDRHKRKAYLEMELFGEMRKFQAGLQVVKKD